MRLFNVWVCLQEYSSVNEWTRIVCVFDYPADFSPLFAGLSEEQSFLFVSLSVFGEMIVGFKERVALFGKEQTRIALFPFIIILLLSPLNILLYHPLSFCPFLPYSPSPLFPFLLSASPPPPLMLHLLFLCFLFSTTNCAGALLVKQPMCLSGYVRER